MHQTPSPLAEVNIRQGIAQIDRAEYDSAILSFTRALESNPAFTEAYFNRALVHLIQGRYQDAAADFTCVLALNPHDAAGYKNRGLAYLLMGLYDTAIADFDAALAMSPELTEAALGKARAAEESSQLETAREAYQAFVRHALSTDSKQVELARKRIATLTSRLEG